MKLLPIFAAAFVFAEILAGWLAILVLVVTLMVRFPPLLIAVVLACWICRKLQSQTSL